MKPPTDGDHRARYIDLIKRTVTNFIYLGGDGKFGRFSCTEHYDLKQSEWTIDPIARPLTLLSRAQLDLIEQSVLSVEANAVPGDFIEAGIWRGGAIILMRALIDAYGIGTRRIFAADSFAGIPLNTRFRHDPVDSWKDRWIAPLDEVRQAIARFGLLDDRIEFVSGYFDDSLPTLADQNFALIRLDSDSYDSVMTSLDHLYPRLSAGGIVIVDDWHLFGCRVAVETYRKQQGIVAPIVEQGGNAWWVKGGGASTPDLA